LGRRCSLGLHHSRFDHAQIRPSHFSSPAANRVKIAQHGVALEWPWNAQRRLKSDNHLVVPCVQAKIPKVTVANLDLNRLLRSEEFTDTFTDTFTDISAPRFEPQYAIATWMQRPLVAESAKDSAPSKSEAYKLLGCHFAGEMAGNDFPRLRALLCRFHLASCEP